MVIFPNAKINIGLNVVKRRDDGYHEIETAFYPLALSDILEIIEKPVSNGIPVFSNSGLVVDTPVEKNLCIKALNLLQKDFHLPEVCFHLHKIIPFGAGLGGGSSDASSTLILLNKMFSLGLNDNKLAEYVSELGSDCSFFIKNSPILARGRGEVFEEVKISIPGMHIIIVKPNISISTAEAYAAVKPKSPDHNLKQIIQLPPEEWKGVIKNDFEVHLFEKYPELSVIKESLYNTGAVYASMSGSGSAVYGIFRNAPDIKGKFNDCYVWSGILGT